MLVQSHQILGQLLSILECESRVAMHRQAMTNCHLLPWKARRIARGNHMREKLRYVLCTENECETFTSNVSMKINDSYLASTERDSERISTVRLESCRRYIITGILLINIFECIKLPYTESNDCFVFLELLLIPLSSCTGNATKLLIGFKGLSSYHCYQIFCNLQSQLFFFVT